MGSQNFGSFVLNITWYCGSKKHSQAILVSVFQFGTTLLEVIKYFMSNTCKYEAHRLKLMLFKKMRKFKIHNLRKTTNTFSDDYNYICI